MMVIKNKFDIEDIVYLTTDGEQVKRMIVSITVNKYDLIYELAYGAHTSKHYDFEISINKNVLVSTN